MTASQTRDWRQDSLCFGRPSEWWDTGDDGNRLAMALCRTCPVRTQHCDPETALDADDPAPVGVIRAGHAYDDAGRRLDVCACGRPIPSTRPTGYRHACEQCALVVSRWDQVVLAMTSPHRRRRQYRAHVTTPRNVRFVPAPKREAWPFRNRIDPAIVAAALCGRPLPRRLGVGERRIVITALLDDGLKHAQIAAQLGMTLAAVRRYVARLHDRQRHEALGSLPAAS